MYIQCGLYVHPTSEPVFSQLMADFYSLYDGNRFTLDFKKCVARVILTIDKNEIQKTILCNESNIKN